MQEKSMSNIGDLEVKSPVNTDSMMKDDIEASGLYNSHQRSSENMFKSDFHLYQSNKNLEDSDPKVEVPKSIVIHHNKTASANTAVQYNQIVNMQHRNCNSLNLNKNLQSNIDSNILYDHHKGSEETDHKKTLTPEDLTIKEETGNSPQIENLEIKDTDKNLCQESSYIEITKKSFVEQEITEDIELYNKSEKFQREDLINLEDESNRINS